MKLLDNQSSLRGESSDSITLTQSFIEACKSYNTRTLRRFVELSRRREWQECSPVPAVNSAEPMRGHSGRP